MSGSRSSEKGKQKLGVMLYVASRSLIVDSSTILHYHPQLQFLEAEEMVLQRLLQLALLVLSLVFLSQVVAVGTLLLLLSQSTTLQKTTEQKSSPGIVLQENSRSSTELERSLLLK